MPIWNSEKYMYIQYLKYYFKLNENERPPGRAFFTVNNEKTTQASGFNVLN